LFEAEEVKCDLAGAHELAKNSENLALSNNQKYTNSWVFFAQKTSFS
jgi:hypothetical protein